MTYRLLYRVPILLLIGLLWVPGLFAQTTLSSNAGRFDNGRMWTFDTPPFDYFSDTYGFDADQEWFDSARLGALRIPGCTASFVSSSGLVLTNHHCGRGHVADVSQPTESLLDDGFYATSQADERKAPNLYADQLVAIEDVTAAVHAAEGRAETDAERAQFRADTIAAITAGLVEAYADDGKEPHVEVISLYHGARHAAYVFRRYEDVRLVMAPELKLGYFGGDADNFTFPRFTLDMTLFRVYGDDGAPLETEHYFQWSLEGATAGDAVFTVGNPGSTSRLETTAQLALRRDVTDRATFDFVESRLRVLQAYLKAPAPEDADAVRNLAFSLKNAQKLYQGRLKALNDATIMMRRRSAEAALLQAVRDDDELNEQFGSVVATMAEVVREQRALAGSYSAFFALTSGSFSSALMRRALKAHAILQAPDVDQFPASAQAQLTDIADQPTSLMQGFLAARITDMQAGLASEMDAGWLQGDPSEMASDLVTNSALSTSEGLVEAIAAGTITMEDPAIQFVASFADAYQAFQSAWAGLSERQNGNATQLGLARFAVYDTAFPPDATFSLRIADGVVKGYEYNGTYAAPFTNFFGLYDHYYSYGAGSEWDLPARWIRPSTSFNRDIPLNFVSTNDIIGGNSGSPVLNKDLELVGLVFDGNIESLAADYIYLPDIMRAISVDSRGMLEALDKIYDADRLVLELTEDEFVATEDEADRRRAASEDG